MELKSYLKMIKKRLWLIVLIVVVSTLTTAYYSTRNYIPLYQASTQLIINSTVTADALGNQQMDLGAISINMSLVSTYIEIIKTPAILDEVVRRYPELDLSTQGLQRTLRVSALNNTQVMTIRTVDYSYERAARIVNAVADVVKTEIPRIMKVNNVEILSVADINDYPPPINQPSYMTIVISFAVSLMVSIGLVFLLELMDDTMKTRKDIQDTLGLPTLATIPVMKKKDFSLPKPEKSHRKRAGDAAYVSAENESRVNSASQSGISGRGPLPGLENQP
jgi:capsular polysaccharide biosynthesis protein